MIDEAIPTQSILQLSYYNTRGGAQPIRTLLQYLELPYQENILDDPKKVDIKQLFMETFQLPKLRDGDFVIHGFDPILKYICRKANRSDLLGKTPKDASKIQQILLRKLQIANSFIMEIIPRKEMISEEPQKRAELIKLAFQSPIRKQFIEQLNRTLSNQDWILEYFSALDFVIYELSFALGGLFPQIVQKYPALMRDYKQRFQQVDGIKEYFSSNKMILRLGFNHFGMRWKGDPKYY